jgi:hypothetical protein
MFYLIKNHLNLTSTRPREIPVNWWQSSSSSLDGSGVNYVFGPTASRWWGRSLGIDPVPLKTCKQLYLHKVRADLAVTDAGLPPLEAGNSRRDHHRARQLWSAAGASTDKPAPDDEGREK